MRGRIDIAAAPEKVEKAEGLLKSITLPVNGSEYVVLGRDLARRFVGEKP